MFKQFGAVYLYSALGNISADICLVLIVGGNMLLARLATTKAKPNGQYQVTSEDAATFIQDIPVRSLPGKIKK